MKCDECKHYSWYYEKCHKWNCRIDEREIHNCFEPRETQIRDKMVNFKKEHKE